MKKSLGRGLDALLSQPVEAIKAQHPDYQLELIACHLICANRYQPRQVFDAQAINELADSIAKDGLLQPIVINQLNTPNNEGCMYEIISGERRWRAFNQLGYQEIPALIKNVDNSRLAVLALIENLQRENLNCMEESKAMHRLVSEFKLTHEEVANQIGKSRTYVTNLMRLQQLTDGVQQMVEQKKIDMGHARCLISLDAASQLILANKIHGQGLSVRQSEEAVKEWQAKQQTNTTANVIHKTQAKEWQTLEEQLSQKLGMRCQIEHQKSGKGKVSFEYRSLEEFEVFYEALQKSLK